MPSAFVFLDALPRTPNGKIDRSALPAPDHVRRELEISFVGPRNQTEETLARIWAEVLRVEGVGIHDNFFELGGHSLSGAQVVSRARELLDADLLLRDVFLSPTVAGLAEKLEAIRWVTRDRPLVSGEREGGSL